MAMFEFKDSEDIKLNDCHTDSSMLVKGENLKRLEVSDSSAFSQPSAYLQPDKRSIKRFFSESLVITGLGFVAALAVAYLAFRFGWTK